MAIFSLHQAYLSYSDAPLLDHIELQIEPGERLCLVGRNGAGKSTLLKVIAGEIPLDDGRRTHIQGLKIARLEQDPPQSSEQSVFDYVAHGIRELGDLLLEYHRVSVLVASEPSEQHIKALSRLQEQLEHLNGWQFDTRIRQILSLLQLDAETILSSLSGGWLRKVAFARAIVSDPDLLLLDEPSLGLAPIIIQQIFNTIEQLREQGMTIFLVEQNANQALKLADRGYVLENGHVVLEDTGDALLANEAVRSAYLGG